MTEQERFELRKREHIDLALKPENQALGLDGLAQVRLMHEALPEIDFNEVDLSTELFGRAARVPFFVSSMTAGHPNSLEINLRLARLSQKKNWAMGVGSQRRELFDSSARAEWQFIRSECPETVLFGNLGLAQVIENPTAKIRELVDALDATAMIVHLNPLQEALQVEGTPRFRGGLSAIQRLVQELGVPVIVKETGCGMSSSTLKRLIDVGVAAVDVGGLGGTHWGRIEGQRAKENSPQSLAANTFADWGIPTAQSVSWGAALPAPERPKRATKIWASGGVRTGLDAAKYLALGASHIGFAKSVLDKAVVSGEALETWMDQVEFELRVAMFCTGSRTLTDLKGRYYVA